MRTIVFAFLLSLCPVAPALAQGEPAGPPESLEQRVQSLEQKIKDLEAVVERQQEVIDELTGAAAAPPEVAPSEEAPAPAPSAPTGSRTLLLPDISLNVQSVGLATNDSRTENRDSIRVREAELGVQSYVYPSLKADAFITMSPAEDSPAQVEEAYLTYLGLAPRLNAYLGQKHVPFGRTNELHSHSWLYVTQPPAVRDLVAEESLTGEGANLSYLLPTRGDLFAQLDVGDWVPSGNTGDFAGHLQTARLHLSRPSGRDREFEVGGSWARGQSDPDSDLGPGHATLRGLDVTYRKYGFGSKRLLLRGEQFWRKDTGVADGDTARGYYLFANNRFDKYNDVGLLYSWSQLPASPSLHEQALSLILTRQFTEQYYLRLQANRGSRPGKDPYHEIYLEWVWGVGPHTHNLE
jgi:hypothetical protein